MFDLLKTKEHRVAFIYIGLLIIVVTMGHYVFAPRFAIAHNLLQRLYYLPILWAAYRFGRKGGLYSSAMSGLLYLPHVLITWQNVPEYQVNQILEIFLFIVIGYSAGSLFDQKVESQRLLQSYEKMAMFGNLSRSIIRSLKEPLKAIKGILITLEYHAGQNPSIQPCFEVIKKHTDVIDTVRKDLISLVERKRMRLKKQNLNDVLFSFISEVSASLTLKNVSHSRDVHQVVLPALINKKAIRDALHQMVAFMVHNNPKVSRLKFFSFELNNCRGIGATIREDKLDITNIYGLKDTHSNGGFDHRLIQVINTMNNHFGSARLQWHDDNLIEFRLDFPKNLKLPAHLKDGPIQ